MPALTPVCGKGSIELVRRLVKACGVSFPVERLVIEVDASQPIRVYVKAPLDYKVVEQITEALEVYGVESVTVDDDTTVHIVKAGQ